MSQTSELSLPVARLAPDNDESRRVLWTGGKVDGRHDQRLGFVARTREVTGYIGEGDMANVPSAVWRGFRDIGNCDADARHHL